MIDAGAIQKMDDDWFAIEGTDRLLRTDSGVLARINKKGKSRPQPGQEMLITYGVIMTINWYLFK